MYIKQVIIQGFKSFCDQTVIEPFDKGHNIIVGKNGSGKSNIFSAIQFVLLSDEFSGLTEVQHELILHKGIGPRVLSASVEIIFDNSDYQLPIKKKTVSFRRVIAPKKNQYFLNGKKVPRMEIKKLLEAAGFCSTTPYYIVEQGKINQWAVARDKQRLNLLREIVGVHVFNEKYSDSMETLENCKKIRQDIDKMLHDMESSMVELEKDKNELEEYFKLDRTKRSLEFIIYEKELKKAEQKIKELEAKKKTITRDDILVEDLYEVQKNVKTRSKELKNMKKHLYQFQEEKVTFESEISKLQKEKIKLELSIKFLNEELSRDASTKKRCVSELSVLESEIVTKEEQLNILKPRYEVIKRKEEKGRIEQKRRDERFATREERDESIKAEISYLEKDIELKTTSYNMLYEEIEDVRRRETCLEEKLTKQIDESTRLQNAIDEYGKEYIEMRKLRDDLQKQKIDLWREENNLQRELDGLKGDLTGVNKSLTKIVDKQILNGLDSLTKLFDTFKESVGELAKLVDENYFGTVIESFKCSEEMNTAVEVTAGSILFHHIVSTHRVATKILKEFNHQKLPGTVNFMVIDKLQSYSPNYPKNEHLALMVNYFEYDKQRFSKVINYIFARTMICRNLDIASQFIRTTNSIDFVTLEGDKISSLGPMTGGYSNKTLSRLTLFRARVETTAKILKKEEQLIELRKHINDLEVEINNLCSKIQEIDSEKSKAEAENEKIKNEIRWMKQKLLEIQNARSKIEQTLAQYKSTLQEMETRKQTHKSELCKEFVPPQLEIADQQEAINEHQQVVKERMELENEINILENFLKNKYRLRNELKNLLEEIDLENRRTRQIQMNQKDLEIVEKELQSFTQKLAKIEEDIQGLSQKIDDLNLERNELKQRENEINAQINEESKQMETITSKEKILRQQFYELVEKIQQFGDRGPDEQLYNQYLNQPKNILFVELNRTKKQIEENYCHVNKKAIEQYGMFQTHKLFLLEKQQQQVRAEEKIRNLLDMTQVNKMNAIQFTFKQISGNFTEYFKKFVPNGNAKLVMRQLSDEKDVVETPMDEAMSDNYTGVGIKVSFDQDTSEMINMNILSGGQKSLVSLALIFAIQKCNPPPFYLFDEIDVALDVKYRKVLAEIIHELSASAQFITTTFRSELLEFADKFYGVKFQNKVTYIECVTKDEARGFVEDDGNEN